MLEKIQKRDGRIVRFEQKKITDAILRALFEARIKDGKKAYELAYKLKCKGITIYRYGSKKEQVLYVGKPYVLAESEYSGGCPTRMCPMPG
jgi:DNA invertase Pin-like site-specific DNA recombinase